MSYVKRLLNVFLLVLVLGGCSTIPVQTAPVIAQEALLQPCTMDTPVPIDTTGKSLYEAFTQYQYIYGECALRHDELIRVIRILNETNKIRQ